MKKIICPLIMGLLMIVFACKQANDDSTQLIENLPDSLRLINALKNAEQFAHLNINTKNVRDTFKTVSDSSVTLQTTVIIDSAFYKKCLRIYRETPSAVYTDIYFERDNKFIKVLTCEKSELTYVGDTTFDVDGDSHVDYLVNWYGSSGCCLKNFYDVYLLKGDDEFSEIYTFINPTFSPVEKVIRGVGYGQPGETELYKYKWSGFKIDTIEYIYRDRNKNGEYSKEEYVRSRFLPWDKRNRVGENLKLKSVPNEYEDIYGYDWFNGFEK